MTVTEITTGKFGNGNTDILKALITRRRLFIPIPVQIVYYTFAENKKYTSEVGYEQIYSLDMPPLDCYC